MAAHARGSRAEPRLRWWALLLPAAVFAALLGLLVSAGGASGEPAGERQPVIQLIDGVRNALLP